MDKREQIDRLAQLDYKPLKSFPVEGKNPPAPHPEQRWGTEQKAKVYVPPPPPRPAASPRWGMDRVIPQTERPAPDSFVPEGASLPVPRSEPRHGTERKAKEYAPPAPKPMSGPRWGMDSAIPAAEHAPTSSFVADGVSLPSIRQARWGTSQVFVRSRESETPKTAHRPIIADPEGTNLPAPRSGP